MVHPGDDMTSPRRAPSRRQALAAAWALSGLVLAGTPVAAEEPPASPSGLPSYLKGIDLSQPAQFAFTAWPSKDLQERAYWLPWSTLSLQRALVLNQPIFLLVTVPWNRAAQRMASEALADPLVLRALNHDYISLLVSADRRPDIYARYGTGNWPAISLLLPNGAPMLSQANEQGKALPISIGPTSAKNVLFNLSEGRKYFDNWQDVLQGVSQVYEKRVDLEDLKSGAVDAQAIDPVVRWLLGNVDAKNGGFGPAPKYVLPGLMEWASLRDDQGRPSLIEPARMTLKKMVASPLYDAREGGFHRMAAAPDWGGIQYEKMLESNAEAIRELVFALRKRDDPALRDALRSTVRFVTTVLAGPSDGFYLAQMADPASPDGGGYWQAGTRAPATAPPVDKLVLTGANALAGAALLRAAAILDDPALQSKGRAALELVLTRAVTSGRGAQHVLDSEDERGRYLVTQSKVALGLEDAYEATGEPRYLAAAKDIVTFVRNNLKVGDESSFRDHLPVAAEFGLLDMPLRPMQDNARFARVLVRLAAQGVLDDGRAVAEQVLGTYAGELAVYGTRAIEPGLAIDELLSEPLVVSIDGPPNDPATLALRRSALNLPQGWVVIKNGGGPTPAASLTWKGKTRRATDSGALAAQAKAFVKSGVGQP
jgi:uncharacterized protein YyaL (SSP411 family)